jgi:hypothetical protein
MLAMLDAFATAATQKILSLASSRGPSLALRRLGGIPPKNHAGAQMFQPAALRHAISWGGNGPRLRWKPGGSFPNPFLDCPVAGLSVIRAEGLNENLPTLRYLRVEELAALTRARRSAYCARGSLQLEGVHDPTMPRLWRQQPCPCQTPV